MAIIGAGIAGLVAGAELRKAGVNAIRLIDQAGGVGGTWYWNRYPGVMCDVESYIYMPMLEDMDYIPKRRFAFGDEIREHLERIAEKYDLVDDALFHTGVTTTEWDESRGRWVIRTDRGDEITARYVVMAVGILNLMKLPDIPGMELFKGKSFHTGRWDYEYTGGNLHGNLRQARRQGRRGHRDRGQRDPVRDASGAVLQAPLRLPAHPVGRRRAGQPADAGRLRRRTLGRVGNASACTTSTRSSMAVRPR